METCQELLMTTNEECPDCGATLSYSSEDLTILECDNGCGWQCRDDPDVEF
jgi:hypothetical protein